MPSDCVHEKSLVDIGGGKSFCDLIGKWTNCREVGHCTATHTSYQQMSLFDEEENETEEEDE